MENEELSTFSAYTRICQKFAQACEEEKVHPKDCLLAIARMLDLNLVQASTDPAPSTSKKTENIQLTKAQVEEAKRVAREEKAKSLGVSPREINLTSQEAKDAKTRFREKLLTGKYPVSIPPKGGNGSEKKKKDPSTDGSVSPPQGKLESPTSKKKVGVQQDKTGSRATAKTKIDNLRRLTLRSLPIALESPSALHLVAYANHRSRLSRQVDEYRSLYQESGMMDPLRGLPDPWLGNFTRKYLSEVTKDLREQKDSPGTFVLQNDNGGSFWDRDIPSMECPSVLREGLPEEVLKELGGQ